MVEPKQVPAAFYRTATGREPVREWLKALPVEDRRVVGQDIATAEYGWPVGMPMCRALGGGLYELRSTIGGGRAARVIFCCAGQYPVLLHGFVKKTQTTPRHDLALAMKRRREVMA
jgi:phage-related protein